ncbi:MAG: SDR family NAD(P)-dependent oxidoreductase [Bacteroidales bacterium]|nr:SDR family NAD(P)-dependent oxidoreductase [Bacteroidales bacterium]
MLVKNIIESYGQIDILVSNAGIHLKKPLTEVSDREYQKVIHYRGGTAGWRRKLHRLLILKNDFSIFKA